jgi:hypothetical protein
MSDERLIPDREENKLRFNDLERLPEKLELYNGNLSSVEELFKVCIFQLGLERAVELLPNQSIKILKEILLELDDNEQIDKRKIIYRKPRVSVPIPTPSPSDIKRQEEVKETLAMLERMKKRRCWFSKWFW